MQGLTFIRGGALLAALLIGGVGCGPPWQVIQQSGPPSALRGAQQVSVATDFSQLMIRNRTLDQEMAARDPNEQAAMQEVINVMDQNFRQELSLRLGVPVVPAQGPPQPGEVRVVARWTYMDMGKYAVIYARDTDLRTRLVWSVGPQVVDEIEVRAVRNADRYHPAIVQRVGAAAQVTAQLAARFFQAEQNR
ncbi:MAG TPA: hypothetical protein RMH85_25570 [Polyangiaceae bacterium LLY-WYZ-15_(1-7)]|nr:hypothetical protein [Polyangiaceae bacterium LLY-WYZ-15_(1-7)]HJL04352.1 hypothetical protein [Polyangiaceae bacterium LLY-WYZ-15_(1-7)]HJL11871.1 hypothetical protein [Polyangiaceae bacterium LLY-WYZ-15_(1-7)]HJL37134.1 hypothetical protein [Polyangiaceae bacterium LLY-WYZ-15_(1-7)]HJL44498.1 hypothetical protein [Polyangiaceae bacterium LLY-WYZ-15_(1-7)]